MYDAIAAVINTNLGWFFVGTFAGVSLGFLGGVLAMASLRLSAKYDRETNTMLDDFGYEAARHTDNTIVYDFRSFK